MATKTSQIIEILSSDEQITQRDIAKRVGCTEGYVSMVKRKMAVKEAPPATEGEEGAETPDDPVVDPTDDELESETTEFVKRIKITPPPETLTENNTDAEEVDEEYQCGSCGHAWTAPKTDYQTKCPGCGEAF